MFKLIATSVLAGALYVAAPSNNAVAFDDTYHTNSVVVTVDQAKVFRVSRPAATIIVGNPAIVDATVDAEENGITNLTSNNMAEVLVFGQQLHRMFRDAILAVGSYGDIYQRNLEFVIPRSGRNMLNANPHLGPQHYIIPGFFGALPLS